MSLELFESFENPSELKEIIGGVRELEAGVKLEQAEISPVQEQAEGIDLVAGTPETDVVNWHMQEGTNSCAVCCQEFIAEQLLDTEFSENDMVHFAMENGWYDPETGTSLKDVGNILEALGLEVERESGTTLADIFSDLESGGKVICGVNSAILQNPDFAEMPGMQADHAVEVIGIDYSNPEQVQVVLNDSGVPNGMGHTVSADTFIKAWETSGRFSVTARKGTVE